MEQPSHAFHDLFAQLGLPNDAASIAQFLKNHGPLPGDMALPDAPFWSPAQAAFLSETLQIDNDWSQQVDQLSKALRQR
ncbi:hypothetical protein B9Z47_16740 [Limnohabitans sp. 2KL-1]|jgi:hypothetical protein|uniref:DUF2789 family protein n=1 Tax=Limnohabitans sp. 2KL-1 TaxID=1100699 RepID=UPI000D3DC431|nr:DUF2789 family protein [Limnohabitans sp. 2KL-1]PUE45063.1 hypothetical protein B9Z47_16740 [Limnohabitans sp. 2KL-1]